jgi:hypothetical protein
MHTPHHASPEPAADARRIFASIELSKSTWIVALQLPTTQKVSVVRIAGGVSSNSLRYSTEHEIVSGIP